MERRVGNDDVRLFEELDALGAAKIATGVLVVCFQRYPGGLIALEEKLDIGHTRSAVAVLVFHTVEDGGDCVFPSVDTAIDGTYPIARPLFMYTNGEPTGATKEYLDWILSDEGQCIILEKGYAPVRSVTCD